MGVLANQPIEQISMVKPPKSLPNVSYIPSIDLSIPNRESHIVKACEEFGFFKITNHGVSKVLMTKLEKEAAKFFSLPQFEKEKSECYGNKRIGSNGDIGWVEYILFELKNKPFLKEPSARLFLSALNEYIAAMKSLSCELLELMAKGLNIEKEALKEIGVNEESDLMFRVNHYPPFPLLQELKCSLTGFGEHTDPQLISILRSNDSNGYQIALKDGSWLPIPPDEDSFFINVGDMLQVLTNGRFKSVKHRVVTTGLKSRVSMIFFGGPSPNQPISALPQLLNTEEKEKCRYIEFTWAEYKRTASKSRLADNRLALFEIKP